MIIANPMDAASLVRHNFPGQTDKGIRMGSTYDEVVAAYGKPDPPQPGNKKTPANYRADYNELGITFIFVDGKLAQIFAVRAD